MIQTKTSVQFYTLVTSIWNSAKTNCSTKRALVSTLKNQRIWYWITWFKDWNKLHYFFGKENPPGQYLEQTLTKWIDDSRKRDRLTNSNKANAPVTPSSEIPSDFNNIGFLTGQDFLHSQLIDAVNAHVHVLKDSLSLIRQLEALSFSREQTILLTLQMLQSTTLRTLQLTLKMAWRNCNGACQLTPAYPIFCSPNASRLVDLFFKMTMSNTRALMALFCTGLAQLWAHPTRLCMLQRSWFGWKHPLWMHFYST